MTLRRPLAMAFVFALGLALSGCESLTGALDPSEWFSNKKPLPGERRAVFPEGVPGVPQGVPPELVQGYQPPPEPPPVIAEEPKPRPAPRPRVAAPAKPANRAPSTSITVQRQQQQQEQQAQQQEQPPTQSRWPSGQPAQSQQAPWPSSQQTASQPAPSQSPFPNPR